MTCWASSRQSPQELVAPLPPMFPLLVSGAVEGVCLEEVLRLVALLTFLGTPSSQPVFLTLVPASPGGPRTHVDGLVCKLLAVRGATL